MAKIAIAAALQMHLKMGLGRMWCVNIHWNEMAYHSLQSSASGKQLSLWIR